MVQFAFSPIRGWSNARLVQFAVGLIHDWSNVHKIVQFAVGPIRVLSNARLVQLGRPRFSSGQQRAEMMMMKFKESFKSVTPEEND